MAKEVKRRLGLIKLFFLSIFTFFLNSCDDIVIDEIINGSSGGTSGPASCDSSDHCKLFVTASTYNGNLGGTVGADAKCQSDANHPGTGIYKALITDTTRFAAPSLTDWVLKASKEYRRLDGTVIGTTTGASIFDPFSNLTNEFVGAGHDNTWSGSDYIWQANNHCLNWTHGLSTGQYGSSGNSNYNDSQAWSYADYDCANLQKITCVQQ